MFQRNLMSRRQVLGTALGGLFLAPLLRERRLEAQTALPKRLVLVFTPDSHPPEWWPQKGADPTSFVLQEPLLDFEEIRSHLLFVQRLDHSWTFDNHHEAGMAQLFTGQRFSDESSHYANGPSIDQVLLDNTEIRGTTPIRSVHLMSAGSGGRDKRSVISYSGPGQPITAEPNPATAFSNIFDGVSFGGAPTEPTPTPTVDPALEARKRIDGKIVQVNTTELKRIQNFLGSRERTKLEAHVEALYELEQRINATTGGGGTPTPVGGTCSQVSTSGVQRDDRNPDSITNWAEVQANILVNAFTCDRTRVAGYQFGYSGAHHNGMFGLQGSQNNNSWHDNVAHISRTNDSIPFNSASGTTRQAFIFFDRFFSKFVANLAKKLAAIQEGDGSMLDNTLLYWGVESGTNHSHNPRDMQYLLIGGKNIGFQSGQYVSLSATESAHKLHTTVLNAFGYPATGFGIEPDCGTLSGIVA